MRAKQLVPALLILVGLPVCAVAEQTEYATVVAEVDVPSKVVNYGDLNLQREEGVAKLYRRIQLAANSVCSQVNSRVPQVKQRERTCASDATARAVSNVGVPALVALHARVTTKATTAMVAARE